MGTYRTRDEVLAEREAHDAPAQPEPTPEPKRKPRKQKAEATEQ